MNDMTNTHEHTITAGGVVTGTVKAAPPVTASGWILAGHQLNEWLILLTILYTVLMIYLKVREIIDHHYKRKGRRK